MIPKLIHHIWIGDRQFPEEFKQFRAAWMSLYADYHCFLWTSELIESENIIDDSINQYYFGNYKIAFKADLLRFKILEKYGGIYIDTDTEPLRRMPDSFLDYKFFAGKQKPNNEIAIGLMGAEKENELVKEYNLDVLKSIEGNKDSFGNISQELWRITGPSYFDLLCDKYKNNKEYMFFDNNIFYPYGWNELHRRHDNFKLTHPDAYSVHHWAHSWW
jgi:mannosyltransferase OCH1-like enzyme